MLSWKNRPFAFSLLISAIIGVSFAHAAWAVGTDNLVRGDGVR